MMKIIEYTPEYYNPLMDFLLRVYPSRDRRYFKWWLKPTEAVIGTQKQRTFIVIQNDKIIACSLSFWSRIIVCGSARDFYWEANTIVDPLYRGKGVGRMIYEQMEKYIDRCTTGFTESAFKIQFRIIKNIKHISTVSVYLSFTHCLIRTIIERLLRKDMFDKELSGFNEINCKTLIARRIDSLDDFKTPNNGLWLNCGVELVRDKEFVQKRFFDIYKKYDLYQMFEGNNIAGYFVVRRTKYMGLNMLSLVDYRLTNEKNLKYLMRIVSKIAKLNGIGVIITLTSQLNFSRLYPLTIATPKKLYGGTTMPELDEGQDFLITSADSDLDFVYYK